MRNFESAKLKVNDHDGNPIEIAAVVVWRVVDTAEAVFHVDDYENFVHVQSEAALRNLATLLPLRRARGGRDLAARQHRRDRPSSCKKEIQDRLAQAGVEVHRGAHQPPGLRPRDRRRHAAAPAGERDHRRAPEDRGGRGRHGRDGARGARPQARSCELDEERKAAMVSNLLVVLCSDRHTQPVVNTGHALPVGGREAPWRSGSRSCCGSIRRCYEALAALGRRRPAQPERADRVPAAPGPRGVGPAGWAAPGTR